VLLDVDGKESDEGDFFEEDFPDLKDR